MTSLGTLRLLLIIGFLEHMAYFAMRSILMLYMSGSGETGGLALSTPDAQRLWGWFDGAEAVGPVIGAALSYFAGARKLLAAGLLAYALGYGVLAIAPAAHIGLPVSLLVVGRGLVLPALYLMLARRFAARQTDRRDGAFAFLSVFLGLGVGCGPFLGSLLYERFELGNVSFLFLLLPIAVAGMAARLLFRATDAMTVVGTSLAPAPRRGIVAAVIVLSACWLAALLNTAPLPISSSTSSPGYGVERWSLLSEYFSGLLASALVAYWWMRRDLREPYHGSAVKLVVANFALAAGLVLLGLGDRMPWLIVGASVAFSFSSAWFVPVALSIAASMLPGRRAALSLAIWLATGLVARRLLAGMVSEQLTVWPAAVVAAVLAVLLLSFRTQLRVSGDGRSPSPSG